MLFRGFAVLLLVAHQALAQPAAHQRTQPVTSWLTPDGRATSQLDSGAYCVETYYFDSLRAVSRVYHPWGSLAQYLPFADVRQRRMHGRCSSWYPDGQLRSMVDYVDGLRQGELVSYYANGTLKRREYYTDDRSNLGSCYDSLGAPVPYYAYEQLPLYPGGNETLVVELQRTLSLTAEERRHSRKESQDLLTYLRRGPTRQILLELQIAPDGRVRDSQVLKSEAPYLNSAALRAVARLSRRFVPGQLDGRPVTTYLTVPLDYRIGMPAPMDSGN